MIPYCRTGNTTRRAGVSFYRRFCQAAVSTGTKNKNRRTRYEAAPAAHRMVQALLVLPALWLAAVPSVQAQEFGTIEGTVHRPDGTPLAGVRVTLAARDGEEVSDEQGAYRFERVPVGSYNIVLSLRDHSLTESGISVTAGETRGLDTTADWPQNEMELVIVRGASRRPERIVDAPAAVSSVDSAEISLQAASDELPRVLAGTPGAEVVQADVYDYSFNTRGYNDMVNRRVLTLIDGRDPSLPGVGTQEWSAISFPLDDIERLEIVRGAGSALYGPGAYNGVIDITTQAPRDNGALVRLTGGNLSTSRLDARLTRDLGGGWFMKATAGDSRGNDFTVPRTSSVEYAPGQLPMDAVDPPEDEVRIRYGGLRFDRLSAEDRRLSFEMGTAEVAGTTTMTGLGRVQQTDSKRPWARFSLGSDSWNLLAYYTAQDSDDIVPLSSGAHLFWDTYNAAIELQGNTDFANGDGRLVGGFSYGRTRLDSASPTGMQTQLAAPQAANRVGVFGQLDYDLTEKLKGVFTARWDDAGNYASRVSPRIAFVYTARPAQTFRASFSKAFLGPSMVQQFLQVPAAAPLDLSPLEDALSPLLDGVSLDFGAIPIAAVGNDQLRVEGVESVELGYQGVWGPRLFVTLDYYQNRLDNFTTNLLPQLGTSLGKLNPAFADYQPPSELTPLASAAVLQALATSLPPELLAIMSNTPDGSPIFVAASLTNFGRVDTKGLEFGLNLTLLDSVSLDLAYAYFDFDVRQEAPENPLAANAPRNHASITLRHSLNRLEQLFRVRWVEKFYWQSGFYAGDVPAYTVADFSLRYDASDRWGIGLDVANLFDRKHFEMFGGSLLRRRALMYATYSF